MQAAYTGLLLHTVLSSRHLFVTHSLNEDVAVMCPDEIHSMRQEV